MEYEETLKCPKCEKDIEVDSIRKHTTGKTRIYWECDDCNLSVMWRDKNDNNK